MSKSVIVLDTPKTCNDCKGLVQMDEDSLPVCVYANHIKYYADKPHWCPLIDLTEDEEQWMQKNISTKRGL